MMKPGAMAFTLTPAGAKWTASHCVKLFTEALAAEYAGILVSGLKEFIDEIFTIAPDFFPVISDAKTIVGSRVPLKFSSKTLSNPSILSPKKVSERSSSSFPLINSTAVVASGELPPAPLMRMSMLPRTLWISSLAATSDF